jgi:hypothetical protein
MKKVNNVIRSTNRASNLIEAKRLEPKPKKTKSPAMPAKPAAMPAGKGSGVRKGGVLIQDKSKKKLEPAKKSDVIKSLETMRKSPVNAGPLKPTVKPNSMAEKRNKRTYVMPKSKSTAKPKRMAQKGR